LKIISSRSLAAFSLITLITLLLGWSRVALAEVMNFTVSPTVVNFETTQGTSKIFELSFYNQGKEPLRIKASIKKMELDVSGVPMLSKGGSGKHDWSSFVSVDPLSFKALPGKPQKVKVVIKSPRGRVGGGYFAVAFDAIPLKKKKRKVRGRQGITLGGQITTLFIGEVPRTGKRKGVIQNAKLVESDAAYSKNNPLGLEVMLANSGTTHLRAEGSVVLRSRSEKGKVVGRFPLKGGSGLILPKGERLFRGEWRDVWRQRGKKLIAEVRLFYSGGSVRKRYPLTIP